MCAELILAVHTQQNLTTRTVEVRRGRNCIPFDTGVTLLHGCVAQAGLADITQSLKMYRPSQTVLEAEMAPSRRGEGAGGTGAPGLTAANGPDGGVVHIMEQKRHAHDKAIQVNRREAQ